jgi:hypothetical protein
MFLGAVIGGFFFSSPLFSSLPQQHFFGFQESLNFFYLFYSVFSFFFLLVGARPHTITSHKASFARRFYFFPFSLKPFLSVHKGVGLKGKGKNRTARLISA